MRYVEKRTALVGTRVTEAQARKLKRLARSRDRTVAAEVRRIILRALDEEEAESA